MITHAMWAKGTMSQFYGTHHNRLDAKGRVSVPAPFRAELRAEGDQRPAALILRRSHTHPCIEAWPTAEFERLAAPLDRLDIFSEAQDDLQTTLYADAHRVEPDKEGRISLPESLVQHAALTDTVSFVGAGRIFRIWEPAAAAARLTAALERTRSRGLTLPGAAA